MKIKGIILAPLLIVGLIITDLFYSKTLTLTLPLGLYIIFYIILIFRQWSKIKFSLTNLTFSIILAVYWLFSSSNGNLKEQPFFISVTIIIITLGTIAFSFYLLLHELETPFSVTDRKRRNWWMIVYTIIPILNWLRYFFAYYPGKMTYDSFWQWAMAHGTREYNAWHPILHTLWIQGTSYIYNSPASYVITQILIVSLIIGYSLFVLQRLGAPVWLLIGISFAYSFYPINGYYIVTMWKDIPFAAFILLTTVITTQIVITNGRWLEGKVHIIGFIVVLFITMNLRNNGFLALLLTLIILIITLKTIRKKMISLSVIIVSLHLIFNGPFMMYMHVIKNPLNQALAIPTQQIGATYKNNGDFTPKLKNYFNKILPEENWIKDYNPYTVDPIKHDPLYNSKVIEKSFKTYLLNWANLLRYNPLTFINSYLHQVSVIWKFYSPNDYKVYVGSIANLEDYPIGIRAMAPNKVIDTPNTNVGSKDNMIRNMYQQYINEVKSVYKNASLPTYEEYKNRVENTLAPLHSYSLEDNWKKSFDKKFEMINNEWKNYYAKGAIPFLLILLGLTASCLRFKQRGFVVFAPVIFVIVTLGMAIPATDLRYSYSFILSVPFLFIASKISERSN